MLEREPLRVFFLLVVDEEEKVLGHLVGHLVDEEDFVWVVSAYFKGLDGIVVKKVVEELFFWAGKNGRSKVRGQTERSFRGWERKWGAKKIAVIAELSAEKFLKISNQRSPKWEVSSPQESNRVRR